MRLGELHKLTQVFTEDVSAKDQKKLYELLWSMDIDPNTFYQELEMTSSMVDTHRDVSYSNTHIQLHTIFLKPSKCFILK